MIHDGEKIGTPYVICYSIYSGTVNTQTNITYSSLVSIYQDTIRFKIPPDLVRLLSSPTIILPLWIEGPRPVLSGKTPLLQTRLWTSLSLFVLFLSRLTSRKVQDPCRLRFWTSSPYRNIFLHTWTILTTNHLILPYRCLLQTQHKNSLTNRRTYLSQTPPKDP